ncbi:MAG: prepilin-type N-terminal cleavage/methylation domain-containing protein [Gemmatimonadetes bacterium]|nr:prepilin-type N-terminal cleavage/methylation domain-containing protein [Gemmatimonadota bacterium]
MLFSQQSGWFDGVSNQGPVPSRIAGYTLIELLIGLFLLSLLSLMTYIRLQPGLEHGKVNGAASVFAIDLQYAQQLAAQQRKPVVVIMTAATASYVIRDRANASTIFRTRYLGNDTDYTLDEFDCTASSLEIFPTGVTRTTTTCTLGRNGYRKQVKYTKAGQIRVASVS